MPATNYFKTVKLSDGNVYAVFDETALRLNSDGILVTGDTAVDELIIDGGFRITEVNEVSDEDPISNVLVAVNVGTDLEPVYEFQSRSTADLLADLGGMTIEADEPNEMLIVKIGADGSSWPDTVPITIVWSQANYESSEAPTSATLAEIPAGVEVLYDNGAESATGTMAVGDAQHIYLVYAPNGNAMEDYVEYIYINNAWEILGGGSGSAPSGEYATKSEYNYLLRYVAALYQAEGLDLAIAEEEDGNDTQITGEDDEGNDIPITYEGQIT